MDPNATLAEIRALVAEINDLYAKGKYGAAADRGMDLAERIEALDEWIANGGFLPVSWWAQAGR